MPKKQKIALSQLIQTDRYSQWNHAENRRETHAEHVDRQFDMHLAKYSNEGPFLEYHNKDDGRKVTDPDYVKKMIEKGRDAVKNFKVLGSQRAAQFGGEAVLRKNCRIYNCAFSFADRPRFFQEAMWIALCGTGTGFSVMPHHVDKLPSISAPITGMAAAEGAVNTFVIPDTIEGWADAVGVLMNSYFGEMKEYISFDYSLIRPEGSKISHGMGTAPGHVQLKKSLDNVRRALDDILDEGKTCLSPFNVLEITLMLMDAVMAGGVRRTASICIFDPSDRETRDCKIDPTWFSKKPWLSNSNNSAMLIRGETEYSVYQDLINQSRKGFGDPGIYWANFKDTGPNPCCEIGFHPVAPSNKKTGWGFCNLSTINVAACNDLKDLLDAAKIAAAIGTLQAGYTDFAYLGAETEEIARHEALIGVSMTGIMEKPELIFNRYNLMRTANAVMFENERVAKALGINRAARATCIKPEGSGSIVLGTNACGIHPPHAKKYLKRVKMKVTDAIFKHYLKHNPNSIELDLHNKNDGYICFAIEESAGGIIRGDDGALAQLERVKFLKKYWVDKGHRPERCLDSRTENNVSNTINVCDEEWPELTEEMFNSQYQLAGVSFSSPFLDISYHNTPNVEVRSIEEKHDDFFTGQTPWPWIKDPEHQCDNEKMDYIAAKWLACLKAQPIDFRDMLDDSHANIKITQTVACSGGNCEVV